MTIFGGVKILNKVKEIIRKPIQSVRQKWNNYKNKWLLVPLVAFFLYVSGIIAQIARNRANWIPGEIAISPSANPLKSFFALFSSYGIRSMIALFLLTVVGILLFSLYREDRSGQSYDKKRNIWYSNKGIHGTAHWMTQEEQEVVFDLTPIDKIDEVSDAIYGITENGKVISRNPNSMLNRHIAVFGASGTMKSRTFVRNQIITCVKRKESMVITDPKAELASDTVEYLKNNGYDVKILNMVKPKDSHRFDALFRATEDESIVNKITSVIIANTGGATGNAFHDKAESNLLNALIFFEIAVPTNGRYPTLGAAYNTLLTCDDFDELKNRIYACGRTSRATKAFSLFYNSSDNLKGNVINGLGSRLEILQNPDIEELVSYSDMDFKKLRTEKCAYFLIISDQDESMRFISSLFINLFFLHLVEYADFGEEEGIISIPVNLMLDEAMNIGIIHMLDTRLSTVRSRLINIYTIFQDIGQIQHRYPGTWSSILGNSDVHLFLGCADLLTAQFISERSGDASVETDTKTQNRSILIPIEPINYRRAQGTSSRKLLTQNEVLTMDNAEMLIIVRGQQIMEAKKFEYIHHPESRNFKHISMQGVMKVAIPKNAHPIAGQDGMTYEVDTSTGNIVAEHRRPNQSSTANIDHPKNKEEAMPILNTEGKPIRARRKHQELEGQLRFSVSSDSARKGVVTLEQSLEIKETEKPTL